MSGTGNIWQDLFESVSSDQAELTPAEFADRHFLNPRVPKAVRDDPDGSFHFNLQLADAEGNAIPGIKKDQPMPLTMRWYQKDIMDNKSRFRVLRLGRRTGKSFTLAVEASSEALRVPNARILILTPNESHIKVLFDDYIRPLLGTYRHRKSGRIGIPNEPSGIVPADCDFVITTDTKKPQEIRITDGDGHNTTIRGMVIGTAARGQSASLLIFDEADYANTEDVKAIVAPIIMTAPDTRVLMSSTPTGRRDSFYYQACQDPKWKQYHHTFEVLPHFTQELYDEMANLSGGEASNTFQQEYLAEFGGQMEGVFDQAALNRSFIINPYIQVLESVKEQSRERIPDLATTHTDTARRRRAYFEGVQPRDWLAAKGAIGSESIYRPEYRGAGVVTAGTDWNEMAGMQTVVIWWPPKAWLRDGRLKVARFEYDKSEPIISSRAKDSSGQARQFSIGRDNGDPGGSHDLSQVKGIVIWHGRLEAGHFNWQSAANRVAGIMSIPDFIDTWYVDRGYGMQVDKLIQGIMESGQYMPDMTLLHKAEDIDEKLMRNIRRFHPEMDPEQTQRMYRTIPFGARYPHLTIDFQRRDPHYKDVMVDIVRRMVVGRQLLFPYGELTGYYRNNELGVHYSDELDPVTGKLIEEGTRETDRDRIDLTGADPARGDRSFGGLLTQMREWRVEHYSTTTGRPKYAGQDHAIDGFMLAALAWWENFSEESNSNIFRKATGAHTGLASEVIEPVSATSRHGIPETPSTKQAGNFRHKHYKDERAPLTQMQNGASPEKVGVSLGEMVRQAAHHYRKRTT